MRAVEGIVVLGKLLASRGWLLRTLECAQRKLVHLVDDLRVGTGRCFQAGPRYRLRRLQIGMEIVMVQDGRAGEAI